MLYPATYPITILKNSTWRGRFRVVQNMQQIQTIAVADSVPVFNAECHKLQAGDVVVFAGSEGVPCDVALNTPYYVISTGLTKDAFAVSATVGGSPITFPGVANGSYATALKVGEPLNLTGSVIDADVRNDSTLALVASFTPAVLDAVNGYFELSMSPATTAEIAVGQYGYDVSITSSGGERYYYLRGTVAVERTFSREV
jgi:hypothetical protein